MKKIFSYIAIFHILFAHLSFFTFQTVEASTPIYASDNYFVVTAYYSPLPNQKYYFKWSYEADVKLNGKWVRWASGKEVFPGMLAAPKSYSFGSKIYLEWIWVWEVADRWGAIVATNASDSRGYDYDRIDIWMWYGDEGLARALQFGKQTIHWYVLADSNTQVSINLGKIPAPLAILSKYEVKNPTPVVAQTSQKPQNLISNLTISPESSKAEDIKKLQTIFSEMGLYSGKVDGKYESIKDTLISYQIKRWLISSKTSYEAGYFWSKTLAQLNSDYAKLLPSIQAQKEKQAKIDAQLASIKNTVNTKIDTHMKNLGTPKVGDTWESVVLLQKSLKTLGFYTQKETNTFNTTIKNALIEYQLSKGIISSKNDPGAWVFGPKTKQSISWELAIVLETQMLKQNQLLSYRK